MTTEHLNNLADALENIAHMEYPSDHHDRKNLAEAARILRSAAGVDVAGLMAKAMMLVGALNCACKEPSSEPFAEAVAALESALRLALAARDDDVFTALDMSPDTFRTEGGAVNVGKLRAAIRHPADYLPPDHWLAAAAPKGTT